MLRSYASGVGLVLACVVLTAHAHGEISPERLAEVNITRYATPCPVNDMVLRDVKGNQVSLASLKGMVVLLNFWKIDCPPCAQEKPLLEGMHRKHCRQGLSVVAVNLFDDQNRIREYVRNNGFSFTFASDPDQRLRVQTQTLPSGMPTCFVVNPKAEAIYEVSMVPTTYVIDRSGRIVARASGMVNWGHPDAERFLEGLLGPPALAQTGPSAALAVRNAAASLVQARAVSKPTESQGVASAERSAPAGTRSSLVKAEASNPSAAGDTGQAPAARLPFQGSPAASAQPDTSAAPARTAPANQPPRVKTKSTAPTQRLVKPTREPASPAAAGRAERAAAPRPTGARAQEFNRPAGQAQGPDALGRSHEDYTALPPRAASSSPLSPTAGRPAPSSLPPAMPYADPRSPSAPVYGSTAAPQRRTQAPSPAVQPDDQGYVTARVPASSDRSFFGRTSAPPAATPTARQYAAPSPPPTAGRNPIGNFVMESFGDAEPSRPAAAPTPQQPAASRGPVSVILNPLNQLGAGIRDTVSKIIPGR